MEDFFKFIDSSFIIAVLSVFSVGQILNTFIKYLLDRRPMVSEIDKKMFMIYSEIYYAVIENPISKVKNKNCIEIFLKLYETIENNYHLVNYFDNITLKLLQALKDSKNPSEVEKRATTLFYRIQKLYVKYQKRMGYRFPLLREMIIVTLYRICFLLFLTMSLIALLYIIYLFYDLGIYNAITDSQYALIPAIFVFSFGLTLFFAWKLQ
ncbi:hypothetical protein MKA44_01775 [[Clostridium] innocuum]|nr:hypothetical protein [[Clostridium] innocuum]